ncbi:MAG TPA: spore germination protein GerW family protein [Thermoanaerobaculia bacterium]
MTEQSLIERIGETIQLHSSAKQVYGDPIERDGTTIIPVARVQWGFGGGGIGHGHAERGGGGGGARAIPTGFIELRDGKAEFRPIDDGSNIQVIAAVGVFGLIAGAVLAKLIRR